MLRDGKWIQSGEIKDVSTEKLIALMVGRDIQKIYPPLGTYGEKVVLETRGLTRDGVFRDISLSIRAGEIVGFAGMMGAGRSEIARAIFGLDQADSGEIWMEGQKCSFHSTKDAIKRGIAMVTEDRASYGFVGVRSIKENIKLPREACHG